MSHSCFACSPSFQRFAIYTNGMYKEGVTLLSGSLFPVVGTTWLDCVPRQRSAALQSCMVSVRSGTLLSAFIANRAGCVGRICCCRSFCIACQLGGRPDV